MKKEIPSKVKRVCKLFILPAYIWREILGIFLLSKASVDIVDDVLRSWMSLSLSLSLSLSVSDSEMGYRGKKTVCIYVPLDLE